MSALSESCAAEALLEEARREIVRRTPAEAGVERRAHWEAALREHTDRYGIEASELARATLGLLRGARAQDLLELGSGQGRDTIFFAQAGLVDLPRFGLVIFPVFLALGVLGERTRVNFTIIGVSSVLLVLATVEWVRWGWIG